MITEITKEQEALIPVYIEKYRQYALNTAPCDRAAAEAAVKALYKHMNYHEPKFEWYDSPIKGATRAAQLATKKDIVSKDDINAQRSKASYGSFESYWVSFYAFVTEVLPVQHDGLISIVKDLVKECGVYWTFDEVAILTERPKFISIVNGKLHNEEGLAVEYSDGTGVFALDSQPYASMLDMVIQKATEKENEAD